MKTEFFIMTDVDLLPSVGMRHFFKNPSISNRLQQAGDKEYAFVVPVFKVLATEDAQLASTKPTIQEMVANGRAEIFDSIRSVLALALLLTLFNHKD